MMKPIETGAYNLLLNCAAVKPGERLLILHESPRHGYYDHAIADAVAQSAADLGLAVDIREVAFDPQVQEMPGEVAAAVAAADHALFLARLGDQLRFHALPAGAKPIVSYALDVDMLASPLGGADYRAFVQLKDCFNALMLGAHHIEVTCPLGTAFSGAALAAAEAPDVAMRRFPMTIFAPVPAQAFAGRVAVARFLMGTGSRFYQPYGVELASTVFAHVRDGRIVDWEGAPSETAKARTHYDYVAGLFGLERDRVHSWHAGIHPGCAYRQRALNNLERWGGAAFGNPRILHFHTCGAQPPGEICWNVIDPTVVVDDVEVWRAGRIQIDRVPGAPEILARHPEVRALFDNPLREIGIEG